MIFSGTVTSLISSSSAIRPTPLTLSPFGCRQVLPPGSCAQSYKIRLSLLSAIAALGAKKYRRRSRNLRAVADSEVAASTPTPKSWWWTGGPGEDSEDEMQVYIPIPDDVTAADIVADIQRTHLTLGIKGQPPVLDGDLWKEIRAHESEWVIDYEGGQRCLIVTLIKRDEWIDYDYLLKSHENDAH
eukprot:TRINITY_DN8636_c2_g1_i2.p1 TRINITY_DN8636_c2_g1~~TRINITY_DN8636_c2_g1_i2.p1  ORF type:complete len:202 (-),score=25.58 TRINITY_DN8636_c2_g1_i2:92-649(-)